MAASEGPSTLAAKLEALVTVLKGHMIADGHAVNCQTRRGRLVVHARLTLHSNRTNIVSYFTVINTDALKSASKIQGVGELCAHQHPVHGRNT